jgi:hypothetical protein
MRIFAIKLFQLNFFAFKSEWLIAEVVMTNGKISDTLVAWPHVANAKRVKNAPYDTNAVPVWEYLHPNGTDHFLALQGGMSQCERYGLWFLTPAPIDCPMRDAFEIGDIDWDDYWESRVDLIRWEFSVYDQSYTSMTLIGGHDFSRTAKSHIRRCRSRSPLQIKLCDLERLIDLDFACKRDASRSEAAYRAFLTVYERRLKKRAA